MIILHYHIMHFIAGLSVCRILCSKGATVVAAGLQPIPDQSNSSELRLYTERGQLHYIHLNLASFKSIHEAVKEFSLKFTKLDVLINNAGVMLLPQMKTAEGFEQHMGVNFIGHSLLTKLLLTKLKMAAADGYSPQIVNVASSVHKIAFVPLLFSRNLYTTPHVYSPHLSYIQSKLAVVLYSECLAQQLSHLTQSSVRVHSVHPGVVASSLYQHTYLPLRLIQKHIFAPMFFRTVDEGSFSILNSIVASTIANGSYVENGTCSFLKFVTNLDKELFWKFISQMIYKTECDVKIK